MSTKPKFILTVDAARARIFMLDGSSPRGLANLTEVNALANPDARLSEAERHSDSNPNGHRGSNGSFHTYDDHRNNHAQEERKRFAKSIASSLAPLANEPSTALICVTHSMYTLLNEAISRQCPQIIPDVHTLECTLLKPHDLTAMLTDKGLLPKAPVA